MIIQHNMLAMNTARQLGIATKAKAKRIERLSSGYRINRAADDAASLAISEKMRAQIRGLQKGSQNVQEAISFCNVGEGALNEVHEILGRVKELAVQAASDTYVLEDREAIEAEFTQLKDEINRISKTTEFNTMRIFDDGRFKVEFTDDVCPIKIFNSTNGNPGDPDTYGGVIVGEDERIAWTTIDPKMVAVDPDTGETVFKAGEYKYSAAAYEFTITCEDGSQPPEIKVEFEVSASSEGIHIAGTTIRWEDVVNENDESILDHLGEEGNYHFRGRGGNGGLYVEEGAMLSDIIKELNRYNEESHRRYYSVYNGYDMEQAVDVKECRSEVQITQSMYQNQLDTGIKVMADENKIWLIDKDGGTLAGSEKAWSDLGLANWSSTNDVSDTKVYEYKFDSTEVKVAFSFLLLDETSKQSVIDGLNNMDLQEGRYITSNETKLEVDTSGNILSGRIISTNNLLSIEEEGMLDRDFDVEFDKFTASKLSYDSTNNKLGLSFTGGGTLSYAMTSVTPQNIVMSPVSGVPTEYAKARAIQSLMNGTNTISEEALSDFTGASSSGFTETLLFDGTMSGTDSLIAGESYAASSIDFSGLGTTFELYDLLGTGFNVSDVTGESRYSVMFTYGEGKRQTSGGYGYNLYVNTPSDTNIITIDLKTIMDKGITSGEEFSKALVEVWDETGYDNLNIQCSADTSGKFYLCDKRSEYVGTQQVNQASMATEPLMWTDVSVSTRFSNGGRHIDSSYTYDVLDAMLAHTTVSQNGTDVSAEVKWDEVYDAMMTEIAAGTEYSITTTDFASCDCTVYENPNKAYVSTFRFQIEEEKDEGMWIQAGPNTYQGLFMKWDGFSSHTLGLTRLSMTNREEASILLRRVDNAIEKVSGIRSAFGAYTNRLEKAYDMNQTYGENLQSAESHMRDADMASEVLANAKADILQQVAQSMLSQANQSQQGILSLLQG